MEERAPAGQQAPEPEARLPARPSAPGYSSRALAQIVARARAGEARAAHALVQRVGETAGNQAAATVAPPAPCVLTATTAPDVPGDLTEDQALAETYNLPTWVQSGNGGGHPINTDCKRREFMRWAREWFGTYRAALAHFNAIELCSVPGTLYLHHDARVRVEAVATELGSDMPTTTVGFSFRADFAGAHPAGTSMHTLGYAADYDAVGMPRIGRGEMALLIELMTGGPANAQVSNYATRRAAIRRMGDRTAAGQGATDGDAGAQTILTTLTTEFARVSAASARFQQILGAQGHDQFLELRTQYFEAAPADRPAIMAQVQTLLAPLYAAITTADGAADITPQRRTALATLRTRLSDPTFLFGSALRPRAPRPRRGEPAQPAPQPTTARAVSAPSLAQLFEIGYISQSTGGEHWGTRFMESMVRHGFETGVVWGGADQDSMHFELVVQRPFTPPAPAAPAAHHH